MSAEPITRPTKDEAFIKTTESLRQASRFVDDKAVVVLGDSLEQLRKMPDNSVSLILTDPPYHSTKKANISGDRAFREDEQFLSWMEEFTVEWRRVLRPNGTVYVFCSSEMSARLEVMMSNYLRPIAHITWTKPNLPGYDGWQGKMKKESLRAWYPHSERILVFEHGTYGSLEAYRRSPFGAYLREVRLRAGLTMVQLTEMIGAYGKVNRGGAVANWEAGRNIPSREQYEKVRLAILSTEKVEEMPEYEDVIRPMYLSKNVQFTDVWDFPNVRPFRGKHPAEKPRNMLEHIIRASSYPGDVVLDCFAGSGSTAVAALSCGRRAVAIELEPEWVARICNDVAFEIHSSGEKVSVASSEVETSTLTLFDP